MTKITNSLVIRNAFDKLVYALYGLTPAEIEIVEGKKPPEASRLRRWHVA